MVILCTVYEDDEIYESSGDSCKPSIITFYNKNKCKVDDTMQKEYTMARI